MSELSHNVAEKFKEHVVDFHQQHGDDTVIVQREGLLTVMEQLRDGEEYQFNVLMDLTVVDGLRMKWKPRFEVVYHLYSIVKNHRLRVKVKVEKKDAVVPSLTGLWPIADWFEREAWDMFGVEFQGHPNLKRILMYDGFDGHPLRKDFPVNKRQPLIGPKN